VFDTGTSTGTDDNKNSNQPRKSLIFCSTGSGESCAGISVSGSSTGTDTDPEHDIQSSLVMLNLPRNYNVLTYFISASGYYISKSLIFCSTGSGENCAGISVSGSSTFRGTDPEHVIQGSLVMLNLSCNNTGNLLTYFISDLGFNISSTVNTGTRISTSKNMKVGRPRQSVINLFCNVGSGERYTGISVSGSSTGTVADTEHDTQSSSVKLNLSRNFNILTNFLSNLGLCSGTAADPEHDTQSSSVNFNLSRNFNFFSN
jgi:hypothetical protein